MFFKCFVTPVFLRYTGDQRKGIEYLHPYLLLPLAHKHLINVVFSHLGVLKTILAAAFEITRRPPAHTRETHKPLQLNFVRLKTRPLMRLWIFCLSLSLKTTILEIRQSLKGRYTSQWKSYISSSENIDLCSRFS